MKRFEPFDPATSPVVLRRSLKLLMVLSWLGLASGCASIGGPPAERSEAGAEAEVEVASKTTEVDDRYDGLRTEALYRLLVAEMAGQRGDLGMTIRYYLEVARATRDAQIAERAVRIAVYARDQVSAMEAATIWVELQPEKAEAQRVLAALLIRAGELDRAVSTLEAFITAWPGKPEQAYNRVADMLAREKDDQAALSVMEQLMLGRQEIPAAIFAHAHLAVRAGQLELASALLERLMDMQPEHERGMLLYAQVLKLRGESARALSFLQKQLEDSPSHGVRLSYARLLVDTRRYEEAREQFESLLEDDQANSDVRYALALLLLQTERLDDAERHLLELVKSGKRRIAASYYLGQIAESRKDFARAIDWYKDVDRGENRLEAQIRIAVLMAESKDLEGAMDQLNGISTRSESEAVRVYLVEGELLTKAGQLTEAMSHYDLAIKEVPRNADLLYARAMLGEKLDRLDILERDLRSIIGFEPNNAQALNAMGYTLADRTDRYAEALGYIERALAIKPNDYYVLDSMGWVLYRMGRYTEALEYLTRAQQDSDDPEVAAHLGEVLWMLGKQKDAREIWDSALQSTPGDKRLLEVIKRFKK